MAQNIPTHNRPPSRGFLVLKFLHGSFSGRVLLGFLLAGLVLLVKKVGLEERIWYKDARLGTYNVIQTFLSDPAGGRVGKDVSSPPLVVIVDISGIATENPDDVMAPDKGEPADVQTTSRHAMRLLIEKVAAAHPRAIGVDIDFSPNRRNIPIAPNDSEFFAACANVRRTQQVPIYLGVYRHAADSKEKWLGPRNAILAAGIGVGNNRYQGPANRLEPLEVTQTLKMFCWTSSSFAKSSPPDRPVNRREDEGKPESLQLRSIAYALATGSANEMEDFVGEPQTAEAHGPLGWAIETKAEYSPEPGLETQGFLVNFRLVDVLAKTAIRFQDVNAVPASTFKDRIVIFGDLEPKSKGDLFKIPGHDGVYAGTLLHGCAVDTLVNSPLNEWTEIGGMLADVVLALGAILSIEALGYTFYGRHGKKNHRFRIHWSVTIVIALVVCAIAVPLVGTFRLAWDDALFVALGLIVHTGLDHVISHFVPHPHPKPKGKTSSGSDAPGSEMGAGQPSPETSTEPKSTETREP